MFVYLCFDYFILIYKQSIIKMNISNVDVKMRMDWFIECNCRVMLHVSGMDVNKANVMGGKWGWADL